MDGERRRNASIQKREAVKKKSPSAKKRNTTLCPVSLLLNAQFFIFKGLADRDGGVTSSPIIELLAASLLTPLILKSRSRGHC